MIYCTHTRMIMTRIHAHKRMCYVLIMWCLCWLPPVRAAFVKPFLAQHGSRFFSLDRSVRLRAANKNEEDLFCDFPDHNNDEKEEDPKWQDFYGKLSAYSSQQQQNNDVSSSHQKRPPNKSKSRQWKTEGEMEQWFHDQRRRYKRGQLDATWIAVLESLPDWDWTLPEDHCAQSWWNFFEHLQESKRQLLAFSDNNDHKKDSSSSRRILNLFRGYEEEFGTNYQEYDRPLFREVAAWFSNQYDQNLLSDKELSLLHSMDFDWGMASQMKVELDAGNLRLDGEHDRQAQERNELLQLGIDWALRGDATNLSKKNKNNKNGKEDDKNNDHRDKAFE